MRTPSPKSAKVLASPAARHAFDRGLDRLQELVERVMRRHDQERIVHEAMTHAKSA